MFHAHKCRKEAKSSGSRTREAHRRPTTTSAAAPSNCFPLLTFWKARSMYATLIFQHGKAILIDENANWFLPRP